MKQPGIELGSLNYRERFLSLVMEINEGNPPVRYRINHDNEDLNIYCQRLLQRRQRF